MGLQIDVHNFIPMSLQFVYSIVNAFPKIVLEIFSFDLLFTFDYFQMCLFKNVDESLKGIEDWYFLISAKSSS